MSGEQETQAADVIRWTFTPEADKLGEIVAYLADLGWDVHERGEGQVVATCDEPEGDLDAIVEGLWAIHGTALEVTHEEFRRTELLVYHAEDEAGDDVEAAAA